MNADKHLASSAFTGVYRRPLFFSACPFRRLPRPPSDPSTPGPDPKAL
jgi:hypothetical protein